MTPEMDTPRRFSVHAADAAPGRSLMVEGRSHVEAALQFVEDQHPPADLFGEAAVMVEDCETGERQCFRIDLGTGESAPCA